MAAAAAKVAVVVAAEEAARAGVAAARVAAAAAAAAAAAEEPARAGTEAAAAALWALARSLALTATPAPRIVTPASVHSWQNQSSSGTSERPTHRGLHSSTFQLNLSRF
jgi:hypothetical protein